VQTPPSHNDKEIDKLPLRILTGSNDKEREKNQPSELSGKNRKWAEVKSRTQSYATTKMACSDTVLSAFSIYTELVTMRSWLHRRPLWDVRVSFPLPEHFADRLERAPELARARIPPMHL